MDKRNLREYWIHGLILFMFRVFKFNRGDWMRIAIFTDTFWPDVNGVAVTLKHYTEYLDKKGIDYIVFAPKSNKDDRFNSQVLRFKSMPFYLYPDCRLALPNTFRMKAELRKFKPDLIHIITPFNLGYFGLRYAKKFGIPVVGSYHTNFDKYLAYYNLQFLKNVIWKYMRWFHRPMKKIYVPSQDTKEQLQKKGFLNVEISPGGVDCNLFSPDYSKDEVREKYGIQEPYILTFVSRLAPEKDVDTLMEISRRIPDHLKDQVHWLIVGDGPAKENMMKNAPKNMTFTGFLSGESLAQVYSAADLFVFPSSTETFGNVVIEALASGTPVIGSNAGGVKTLVTNNHNGILCEPKQVDQFVAAIESLINDDEKRENFSVNARDFAMSQSWESIFDRLIEDFEDVLTPEIRYQLA